MSEQFQQAGSGVENAKIQVIESDDDDRDNGDVLVIDNEDDT